MTFLLATPFLFVLIAALIIAISIAVEVEREGWATTFFSVSIVLLFWHFWTEIWGWVSLNPLDTALFVGGYIVGGIIWAIIKWKSYISKSARVFNKLKTDFIAKHGEIGSHWREWTRILGDNSKELKVWPTHFYEDDEPEDIIRKITISSGDKKSLLVSWISYWPMSIASTLLNDPVRRLMSYIYDRISGIFQRMSVRSTKGLGEGMNKYEKSDQKS